MNGLRACVQKGFMEYFKEADADIFCLQETKLQGGQIELDLPGYHQYWNYAEKKGYSGTALFTKEEPLKVSWSRISVSSFPHFRPAHHSPGPVSFSIIITRPGRLRQLLLPAGTAASCSLR